MPPPPLVDDLVEQVLLRFPPKDPAALVRAALVCKSWLRLVSSPSFRRRFSEFHRKPPMLGMFCSKHISSNSVSHFVPTTAFRPHDVERGRIVVDTRHGRVLLREGRALVVWDPITDDKWKVPFPLQCTGMLKFSAAVLCSAAGVAGGGCDHLACRRGPFIVVLVASVLTGPNADAVETSIYTYSSDAAAWSEPTCGQRPGYFVTPWIRSTLVGNTLYFASIFGNTALKYNMQLRQMSWIQLPPSLPFHHRLSALTTTEDGRLQCAIEHEYKLNIWSTKDADEIDTRYRWEQNRVIELDKLLPVGADLTIQKVVGFMDGLGTIFVSAADAAYAIDLMTCKVKKVYEGTINTTIIPYMSFYTPGKQTTQVMVAQVHED